MGVLLGTTSYIQEVDRGLVCYCVEGVGDGPVIKDVQNWSLCGLIGFHKAS